MIDVPAASVSVAVSPIAAITFHVPPTSELPEICVTARDKLSVPRSTSTVPVLSTLKSMTDVPLPADFARCLIRQHRCTGAT